MNQLSFSEIPNWQVFEDLAAEYFRTVRNDNEYNVSDVTVNQTGVGSDGGRDILVTLNIADSIKRFERKWVVQCKFHANNVGKGELADINIPSLIHEYNADGYLLICKEHLTAPLTTMFENLNRNCKFRYSYEFWSGTNFIHRIRMKPNLIVSYFPRHQQFLNEQEQNKLNF